MESSVGVISTKARFEKNHRFLLLVARLLRDKCRPRLDLEAAR